MYQDIKILPKLVQMILRPWFISILQVAIGHNDEIFKSVKSICWGAHWGIAAHRHANFVEICQSIADIGLNDFSISQTATAAILNFTNHNILLANSVCRAETHHSAKFCHWSTRRWHIAIFRIFKMAVADIWFSNLEILFEHGTHNRKIGKSVVNKLQFIDFYRATLS